MGVPISQMWTVASYVMRQRMTGRRRYPLVLMLEPLFRCNLACAGCGKIQHPKEILKKQLTPEECFAAVEECGAPVVSIPGGEPLLHPQIDEIVAGLVQRKKYVYLCTNAVMLEKKLDLFTPSRYLSFSIHLDGPREEHDASVCREGVYDKVIDAAKTAIDRGFRVTTNSTLFNNSAPEKVRELFDTLAELGVEGMMISPGYPYEKAPDQEHFLHRRQTETLFHKVFQRANRRWQFNQSPLFLEFLRGNWDLECTPWGMPTYNLFGWQKPCYLLDEGYCDSFEELMETTEWEHYGCSSGNPKCTDCMVHSGYEATAVNETFGSIAGMARAARITLFGLPNLPARTEEPPPPPATAPSQRELVQLDL